MQVASKWGTFVPNLDTLGLLVLELFFIYGTDGRTDRQTDRQTDRRAKKSNATGGGIITRSVVSTTTLFMPLLIYRLSGAMMCST